MRSSSLAWQCGDASEGCTGVGGAPPSASMLLEAHFRGPAIHVPLPLSTFFLHILLMSRQTRWDERENPI
jgi:hypothetical protein